MTSALRRKVSQKLRPFKHAVFVGVSTARAVSLARTGGDEAWADRPELGGVSAVDHLAMPALMVVLDVDDRLWRGRGEWVLDVGVGANRHIRQSCYATWQDALDAALALPARRQTSDVLIMFRNEDRTAGGVEPFAVDPVPPAERLARIERERRAELAKDARHMPSDATLRAQRKAAGMEGDG